jgi:hypothetical protein
MRERYGYPTATFVRRWALVDVEEFDFHRNQLGFLSDVRDPDYLSNFVFPFLAVGFRWQRRRSAAGSVVLLNRSLARGVLRRSPSIG